MDVECFSFALDGDDAGLLLGGEESVQRGEIGGQRPQPGAGRRPTWAASAGLPLTLKDTA